MNVFWKYSKKYLLASTLSWYFPDPDLLCISNDVFHDSIQYM